MLYRRSTISNTKCHKKRKKSVIPWKKEIDKIRRCQPKGPPLPPACRHSYSKFECSSLGQEEMESFHRRFYYTRDRANQDAFILRHCEGRSPKRRSTVTLKKRRVTTEYYVPTKERKLQVCKAAFVGILQVKTYRINSIVKSFYMSDDSKLSSLSSYTGECLGAGKKKGERRNNNSYKIKQSQDSHNSQIESSSNTCATNEDNSSQSLSKTCTDEATFPKDVPNMKHDCLQGPKKEMLKFHRSRKWKTGRESIFSRNCLKPQPKENSTENCNDTEIHVYKTKSVCRSRRQTLQKKKKQEIGRKSCLRPIEIGKVGLDIENYANTSIQNETPKDEESFMPELSYHNKSLPRRKPEENTDEECKKEKTKTQRSNDTHHDTLGISIELVKRKRLRFCTPVNLRKVEESKQSEAITLNKENQLILPVQNKEKNSNNSPCGNNMSCPTEFYKFLPKPDDKLNYETFIEISSGSHKEYYTEERETDWLNSKVKQRRVRSFDWSPPRRSLQIDREEPVKDCSETNGCPKLQNHSPQGSQSVICSALRGETKCNDTVPSIKTEPTKSLLQRQKVSQEYSPGLVYESNRRRLRKLQRTAEEKENIPNNNKQKDSSMLKPKLKPILIKKNIEKNTLLPRTDDNKFEQKSRLPLQTIQYFKNQRFIYGKT